MGKGCWVDLSVKIWKTGKQIECNNDEAEKIHEDDTSSMHVKQSILE